MEFIQWNQAKNDWLKKNRGVCFEDIVLRIHTGHVLAVVEHPNQKKYPGQELMIINIEGYAYVVPFIVKKDCYFFKTIIPSRKHTKKYLKEE